MVPLFKHWRTTYERLDKFLSDTYFTDVNLHGKILCDTYNLTNVSHLNVVTHPKPSEKDDPQIKDETAITFDKMISLCDEEWTSVDIASFTFGPTWSVHWFKICLNVPDNWLKANNNVVELQWKSGCEVLVYSSTGKVLKGLNSIHSRISVPIFYITESLQNSKTYSVYMQASCSDLFGAGDGGMIKPPAKEKSFNIEVARLALVSILAKKIAKDLRLMMEIADAMKDSDRGYRALYIANEAVNAIVDLREDDINKKLLRAQEIVDKFFEVHTGSSQLTLHAMGHCHIDSAWLWRYGETRRKLARSWSTTLRLLEKFPNMTFVCSQAQQLSWLKEDYPNLFTQLQNMAIKKQFLPAGGVWVEMDVNLPCCESLCRQFLYGQRFFKENFGAYCKEFWLPDTFGYSPQLPQIMQLADIRRFMTQKLSWSLVNKFPHHTFWWIGIDGSKVLTHFPPGNSYSMNGKISEILDTVNNFLDKGRSSSMMYLYGYGDGGQGPTEEMVHVINRLEDCNGIPKIKHSSPDIFFSDLEANDSGNLCNWSGELFLELHNGTYTTQRQIKKGNSHCEQLLRAVEFLVCLALIRQTSVNHGDQNTDCVNVINGELESKWKLLLLNQFHDVLPGSSIEMVCDDAFWALSSLVEWCCSSIKDLNCMLTQSTFFGLNPTSWPLILPVYKKDNNTPIGFASIPPYTIRTLEVSEVEFPNVGYFYNMETQLHRIWNKVIDVYVDDQCRITSIQLISSPELGNVMKGLANELFLYDDIPLYWDAWDVMDYHLETGVAFSSLPSFKLIEKTVMTRDDIHVTLTCSLFLENTGTLIEKSLSLYAHMDYVQLFFKVVNWNENHKFLKVRIPTRVLSSEVHYSTQAGLISRPNHRNTSWDSAKFEVCSHEWVHIGEANWGVALFKDAIFGSSVYEGTLFLSLLRSPTSPDATADRKYLPHLFSYAIYPYNNNNNNNNGKLTFATLLIMATQFCWLSTWKEKFSSCLYVTPTLHSTCSFPIRLVSPLSGEVAIDWIKPKCDGEKTFVVRIHEKVGGRFLVKMKSDSPIKNLYISNILEELVSCQSEQHRKVSEHDFEINITPFKIVSIVIEFMV